MHRLLLFAVLLSLTATAAPRKPRFTAAALTPRAAYLGRLEFGDGIEQKSKLFESAPPYAKWKEITLPKEAAEHEILHVARFGEALLLVTQWSIESGGPPHVYVRRNSRDVWAKKGELPCTVLQSVTVLKGRLKAQCIHDNLAQGTSIEREVGPLKLGVAFREKLTKLPVTVARAQGWALRWVEEDGWPTVAELSHEGQSPIKVRVHADQL